MSKFKVGDRVKVIRCEVGLGCFCVGHEGVVDEVTDGVEYPYVVKFDGGFNPGHSKYCDTELVLLTQKRSKSTKQKELIAIAFKLGEKSGEKRGYQKGYQVGRKFNKKLAMPTFEEAWKIIEKGKEDRMEEWHE